MSAPAREREAPLRRASWRALPTMLRVHFAEVIAWRAEFLIWFLAYTLPLIMMALWTAVAREAPVGRFGEAEFRAYFLATLVFRMLAASWVVWDMNFEIRQGLVVNRLLRPIHPLLSYATQQAAAFPMRLALATPVAIVAILWLGPAAFTGDPLEIAMLPLVLLGAWAMSFLVMALVGSLAFFWESALGIFDLWLGLYLIFSGYLVPIELFTPRVAAAVRWLPFRYMLSFPVEVATGTLDRVQLWENLAVQWSYVTVFAAAALTTWRLGARRYSTFGG